MTSETSPVMNPHESLTDPALAVLANNPARALTYLVVTEATPRPLAPSEIRRRLQMRQGSNPGWNPGQDGSNMRFDHFCFNALSPCNLLAATTAENKSGKPVRAYSANLLEMGINIPRVGATLDWELQFPGRRLTDVLGMARAESGWSTGTGSLPIYHALATAPEGKASLMYLRTLLGQKSQMISRTLLALERFGNIEKQSKLNLAHRSVLLGDVDDTYPSFRLAPWSQALLKAVQALRSEGISKTDGQTLLNRIIDLYPEIDPQLIRHKLTNQTPSFVTFDDEAIFGDHLTSYQIRQSMKPIIMDLLLRLALLETNVSFAREASQRAREILANKEDVAFLMAKAKPRKTEWRPGFISEETQTRRRLGSLTFGRFVLEPDWEKRAACKDEDGELFFPLGVLSSQQIAGAKAICSGCPVKNSCLQKSLDTTAGVFGEMSPEERRRYLRDPMLRAYFRFHGIPWPIED